MPKLSGSVPGFNSLFWRLFAGLCLVIFATASAVWVASSISHQRRVDAILGSLDTRYYGQRAVETAAIIHRYGGTEGLVAWLRSSANERSTVWVMSEDGTELSGREVPERAKQMLRAMRREPFTTEAYSGRFPDEAVRTIEIDGQPYLVFATHSSPPDKPPPRYLFFRDGLPAGVAVITIVLITLIVSGALAFLYTRPVRRLDDAMERFAAGDFDVRVGGSIGPAGSEVTALARVFDRMADQIQKLVMRQRRLFHDVSHEVRSPLARIDVALELARIDPKHIPPSLDRIEKEVHAIDRLIEALLTYARLEDGAGLPTAPVSARQLIETVREAVSFEGRTRGVTAVVRDHLAEDAVFPANEEALISALGNLARNALRYTPDGGEVRLELDRGPDSLIIRCRDQGPGMPEEELEHIFDPFVRGGREKTGTGFGLGLAIAKSAVKSQRGRISVKNVKPHGLEFTIALPLAAPDVGRSALGHEP